MKRSSVTIAVLLLMAAIVCAKNFTQAAASQPQPLMIAQAPVSPPPPGATPPAPMGPNLSLNFNTGFLKDILGGLCTTNYQIYLGDNQNYIIFKEMKWLQNIPAAGDVEVCMNLDFAIKKWGVPYRDTAEATMRLKLSAVKKDNKILLRAMGRLTAIKTSRGQTVDENVLLPLTNKALAKGPLFEVPLSDIAHVLIPWPKLGDSPRVTELNLNDATVEIQPNYIVFHMSLVQQTRKP